MIGVNVYKEKNADENELTLEQSQQGVSNDVLVRRVLPLSWKPCQEDSLNLPDHSKAFRVYNLVTKRVEVNLHVNFLEEKPNVQGIGHRWMFDLDYLTDSMNYNLSLCQIKANTQAAVSEKIAKKKTHSPKQPSSTPISKSADDIMTFRKELDALALKHLGPVPATAPTSTNPVNTGSDNLNTGFEEVTPGNIEAISPSADHEEEVFSDADDDEMPEIRIYDKSSEGIFEKASYDDDGIITDFNNLPDEVDVSTHHTLRIHNAHPQSQILGDPNTPVQTRSSLKKITEAHALVSYIQAQQRSNHKDQQHCLFACFLSQSEPRKVSEALEDESWGSWVEAHVRKLLQYKSYQQVMGLVDLPNGAKVIGRLKGIQEQKEKRESCFQKQSKAGLQVTQNKECIFISHDKYVAALLQKFDLVTPKTSHLNAVKRIFKYLKGKPNLGLWYPRESPLDWKSFSDSDYGVPTLTWKSTTVTSRGSNLSATIDTIRYTITEASIRESLQLDDATGITMKPLVFGPAPRPAGDVDPDVIESIIFGPLPRPHGYVDPDFVEPIIFGPQPRPDNYLEPEDLDNLLSMEDDTTHSGFHVESHVRPDDASTLIADAAGRAEDPVLLTSLSAKLDRCMGRIDSLETELGKTKKIMGGAILTLVSRVKKLEETVKQLRMTRLVGDVPAEEGDDVEEREEEEVPLRRKRSAFRRARTTVAEPAGPSVAADKGKAPVPDFEIPAEFLAEDAQARKRFEEEQASERLVQQLQAEDLVQADLPTISAERAKELDEHMEAMT
ncbi:hypothetical protein Tco_0017664 [Tanacetum coccineum]